MLALEAQLRRVSALAAACKEAICSTSNIYFDVTVEQLKARGRGGHDPVLPGPPAQRAADFPHEASFAPPGSAVSAGSAAALKRDLLSSIKHCRYGVPHGAWALPSTHQPHTPALPATTCLSCCTAQARTYHTTAPAIHAAAAASAQASSGLATDAPVPTTAEAVLPPALEARVRQLHARCAELVEQLSSGADQAPSALREAGREYSRLQPLAAAYDRLVAVGKELSELESLLRDPDPGVRALAAEEEAGLREQGSSLTRQLLLSLLPPDPRASRPALLEVRAGAGGEEATLFAAELLAMYERYAQLQGWSWQLLELSATDLGGVRHAVAAVGAEHEQQGGGAGAGAGAGGGQDQGPYGMLRPEAGVHRVQRVPVTDAGGRVHTSTAAVVVLPQADEVDVVIRDEDIRVETMRASGAGGQHVNVTDSAVRLTHLPTGTVVACQNERSQHRNLAAAMKVLRSRLYDMEMQKRSREVDSVRQAAVGTAERNERIRTYNYQQNRVTDHRVGVTVHDLAGVLAGEALDRLLVPLRAAEEEAALRALMEQEGAEGA